MQGYKKVTASTFAISSLQDAESDINNNSIVLDCDTTTVGGNITISLPPISSLLFGVTKTGSGIGAGALSFRITGTVIGASSVIINPGSSGGVSDTIGGKTSKTATGAGVSFELYLSGLTNWGYNFNA